MKYKDMFVKLMMTFFVVTACVTILQAVFGAVFMPDAVLSWRAFYSPPLLGALSSLLSLVTYSSRELTMKQELCRKALHLFLIEILVLTLNRFSGNIYSTKVWIALIICVAIIYIVVNLVLYINDQKSAEKFNRQLKEYQKRVEKDFKQNDNNSKRKEN